MNNLLLLSLLCMQAIMLSAQNSADGDSMTLDKQRALTENDAEPTFYYFNNEWIPSARIDMVDVDSIIKIEVKNDEYDNRATFVTISPETLAKLKADVKEATKNIRGGHSYPTCQFPGGDQKLKEWVDANIRIPEGFKGSKVVLVTCRMLPDGTPSDPKLLRPSSNAEANAEALRLVSIMPKFHVRYYTPKRVPFNFNIPIRFTAPGTVYIRGNAQSFTEQFPEIEQQVRKVYETSVFFTHKDPDFKMADICTESFIRRLADANGLDSYGYATWLLRSGQQDGDDSPSQVLSVVPGEKNTIIVSWSDMGHKGSTTLTMIESDGGWKIDNATVPEGYPPL